MQQRSGCCYVSKDSIFVPTHGSYRLATVVRVAVAVVLKYSENLVAEPERAAVAAAVAKERQLLSAVRSAVRRVPVQVDCTTVRLSRTGTARGTAAAVLALFNGLAFDSGNLLKRQGLGHISHKSSNDLLKMKDKTYSTSISKVFDLKETARPESSVLVPTVYGTVPSAVTEKVPPDVRSSMQEANISALRFVVSLITYEPRRG